MSVHHRPLRSSLATVAIAGAATLATVFASTPAMADDLAPTEGAETTDGADETPAGADDVTPEPAPEATDESADGQDAGDDGAADGSSDDETAGDTGSDDTQPELAPEAAADEKNTVVAPLKAAAEAADEIVADFGYEKFRVGVQVADGSFVPEGGTLGSTFEITITGGEGGPRSFDCTTTIPSDDDQGTSFCAGAITIPTDPSVNLARSVTIEDGGVGGPGDFQLDSGETATIVQTGAVEGLEPSTDTAVLAPCSEAPDPAPSTCDSPLPNSANVLFENVGTPPDAVDDSATTDQGEPVDIDLLANDDPSIAPITGVTLDSEVAHGTVDIDDAGVATYTPDADFSGTETFTYALSTQNGSDAATVTVEVAADEVAPAADEVTPTPAAAPVSSALPDTGGPDASLLGYAALLLAGGGWMTARARRRPSADRG